MAQAELYPLRFEPLFRQYLWGGRRLATVLHKPIGPDGVYAESWEVADHGEDQTRVQAGPLAGRALHELWEDDPVGLLGDVPAAQRERFPLLLKFLDAHERLSVQVHPDDEQAARQDPPDYGKTECWYILHADPGSRIYAGLAEGIDRAAFEKAIAEGRVVACLHAFEPQAGDVVFLPARTVHALGAGILVAELQESSDTTYRIYDWDRRGPDGRPRPLHIGEALEVIDFARGPIEPARPVPVGEEGRERLAACAHFVWDRWCVSRPIRIGDGRSGHLITCVGGAVTVSGDPSGRPLEKGETIVLPASCGAVGITPVGADPAVLLDAYVPCDGKRSEHAA